MNWIGNLKTSFESGIESTVNWYLKNPKWWENLSDSIFEHTPWKKIELFY